MPSLWTLDEFDAHDSERALRLRHAPSWSELVGAVREALHAAIESENVRFGVDESGRDSRDLRGVVQFPLGTLLFDWIFNSTTGYRAQFRIGRANGLAMNAQLIGEVTAELGRFATTDEVIHRYTSEFTYKESTQGKVSRVAATLDPKLSKVWVCEKLIGNTGQIENLFVSRTGPKLVMPDTDPWSSLYPEDADGWLDVKGAFVPPTGQPYQLKSPEERAAKLEERGSA
ncbi:hypothetical protein SAMN04244573_04439 [Azotobacter beijerinckii]|uniref:Uncharacterized protein n=1 Tax=Azotobacter beijerinckii TaxID=170623 RepID=A0A1H9SHT9_9GAMM|nr:hypothetical protein [Azotobacter beijerinckii]SER84600.1 hypothetical protein SAMN04244573_04439 [Azotobacter beijerinckii]